MSRAVMQEALEALEALEWKGLPSFVKDATTALRQALAEPEQKPIAWLLDDTHHVEFHQQCYHESPWWTPLYTAPTPRKPLTDEEIDRVTDQQWAQNNHKPIYAAHRAYARAVIAAYEAKNSATGEEA